MVFRLVVNLFFTKIIDIHYLAYVKELITETFLLNSDTLLQLDFPGMLHMLMDTDLDVTQQDYVRTAQASGKALVSLINEVLDQAKNLVS